jgi:hypothetical protein
MKCLSGFLHDEQVRNIIEACRASSAVQGILVGIEPRWLRAWRIGERYDPNNPTNGFNLASTDERTFALQGLALLPPWMPFRSVTVQDLGWQPPNYWPPSPPSPNTYLKWPVVMRICLYPRDGKARGEAPFFQSNDFQIEYEVRPVARLYVSSKGQHRPLLGGISIGVNASEAGTMGGILTDRGGKFYGVTCAHVAPSGKDVEQPARIDRKGSVIGKVAEAQLPSPFPSYARKIEDDQQKYASKVDVALIEIDPAAASAKLEVLKMGKVTSLVALDDIEQDEELELTGRASDWQKVQRSSLSPYYNVKNTMTGNEYCFENVLVFREPSGGAAARPGDSGGWICKEVGTDYHWAALVVGGDKQLGFAIAAHELKAWWEDLPSGYKLSVCCQ